MPPSGLDPVAPTRTGRTTRRVVASLALAALATSLLAAPPATAQEQLPDVAAERLAQAPSATAVDPADPAVGSISGHATAPAGFRASAWTVFAVDAISSDLVSDVDVAADGSYLLPVPPGTYRLLFIGKGYRVWPNAHEEADGTTVVVEDGEDVTGIDMDLTLFTHVHAPQTLSVPVGNADPVTLPFRVTVIYQSDIALTGEVVVRLGRDIVARTTLRPLDAGTGAVTLPTDLPVGDHTLVVEYAGGPLYDAARSTVHLSVTHVPDLAKPVRLLDTSAPGPVCVDLDDVLRVPGGATGVMINVTASAPSGPGYGVVYADAAGDGSTRPPAGSTVNFEVGADVANWAMVNLAPGRRLCYATGGTPDVRKIVDLMGYVYGDTGLTSTPVTRLLDTRPGGTGEVQGPVAPRTVTTLQVAGRAGVPADAKAALLNVTVTGTTTPGNLRVFPGGTAVPGTSVVNFAPGVDKANATLVQLVDGKVSFWSDSPVSAGESPVQVILDVIGYTRGASRLVPVTPTRINDSRPESRIGNQLGRLHDRAQHVIPLLPSVGPGSGLVPSDATAVLLNVTAVSSPAAGNLRVFSRNDDYAPPLVSTLNYIDGRDVANLVMVPVTREGGALLYSDSDLGGPFFTADVVGYMTGR